MALGQFYFAWVSDSETFSPTTHARYDMPIFDLEITAEENSLCRALVKVQVTRPMITNSGGFKRCFISVDTTPGTAGGAKLMFDGRMQEAPSNLNGRTLDFTFFAQSLTWQEEQTNLLVETKYTLPQYDPVCIDPSKLLDPVEVLAGWGEVLCWSRTGGPLIASGILQGGSGTIALGKGDFFYNSLKTRMGEPPLNGVTINLECQYTQGWSVEQDIFPLIAQSFPQGQVCTLTPDSLEKNFPGKGSSGMGTGYTFTEVSLNDTQNTNTQVTGSGVDPTVGLVNTLTVSIPASQAKAGKGLTLDPVIDAQYAQSGEYPQDYRIHYYTGVCKLRAEYHQPRKELMVIQVDNSIQQITSTTPKIEQLQINCGNVVTDVATAIWQPNTYYPANYAVLFGQFRYVSTVAHTSSTTGFYIDFQAGRWTLQSTTSSPIGWAGAPSYLGSARGYMTQQHAYCRAFARLAATSRSYEVTVDVPFDKILDISLDHNCMIDDGGDRLPVGGVTGKVTGYSFKVSGKGDRIASVHIAAAIGKAYTQPATGGQWVDVAGVTAYMIPFGSYALNPVISDAFSYLIGKVTVTGDPDAQQQAAILAVANGNDPIDAINATPTKAVLDYIPLTTYPLLSVTGAALAGNTLPDGGSVVYQPPVGVNLSA